MPLRVAPCPKCQHPLVFGERSCRTCGQVFNYGTRNPPEPSFPQMVEALRAAGYPPPSLDEPVRTPSGPPRSPAPAAPAPHPRSIPDGAPVADATAPGAPAMAGLETGRFASVGYVAIEDVPGFMDSGIYRAFTPDAVNVTPVAGMETGRATEVGEVRVQRIAEVEPTAKDAVGAVSTQEVPGIFHSDFLKAPEVPLRTQAVEGLEASPSTQSRRRPKSEASAAPKGKGRARSAEDLGRALCLCGETHRLPRCPACGTPHPDAGG